MISKQMKDRREEDGAVCPVCKKKITKAGLSKHIDRMHKEEESSTSEASGHVTPTSHFGTMIDTLKKARQRIPVIRIVPKSCRLAVSKTLEKVLVEVAGSMEQAAWMRLFSFAYIVLRLPPQKKKKVGLTSIIMSNIREFESGSTLEQILETYSVRPAPNRTEERASVKRAAQKLSEGDIRGAVHSCYQMTQ